jgi:hypothetical protein
MVPALDGRLPVAVVPVVAVLPVMALDSCEENDIDAPGEPVEAVVLVAVLVGGVNAVARLASWELIIATRAVTSEMLIVSFGHRPVVVRT